MVYNFWQLCQNPDDPEDHYFRMNKIGKWAIRDTADVVVPSANLITVNRSAKKMGYTAASFGPPPSTMVAMTEKWVQDKCKLLVDSLKHKCPVVLYSRFSVTKHHQHIVTVAGYALFASELWFLILDPESLRSGGGRMGAKMFSLCPDKTNPTLDDLKEWNKSHNAIRFLVGDFDAALGALYFVKASHLFAAHCKDAGKFNYQDADHGSQGNYIHHGDQAPSIAVPDELVLTSGAPQVTVPIASWWSTTVPKIGASLNNVLRLTVASAVSPALARAVPAVSFAQLLETATATKRKIMAQLRDSVPDSLDGLLSTRNTLQPYQGYFPIGMQGAWHGGIHIAAEKDASIHLYRDGVVVAARLPPVDPAKPNHGSRNIVLVRHQTREGKPYWSLYMHLRPIPLGEGNPTQQLAMPWLYRFTLTKTGEGGTVMRTGPHKTSPKIRDVALNESFSVLDSQASDGMTWHLVHSPADGTQGWIAKTERVQYAMGIPELPQFKEGKVVALNRQVQVGTCLGFVDPDPKSKDVPYFHWEIFSQDPLPGGWHEVCDQATCDQEWIGDLDLFKKILNRNDMGPFTEPLTPNLILQTYTDKVAVKKLRNCACKFVSEWSIDWSKVDEAKMPKELKALAVRDFQPYSFWKEAVAAGVDLPKDAKVWHYNPREALNRLHPAVVPPRDKLVGELAQQLVTKWRDTDGSAYQNDQNAHNVWIQLAATNHGLPPLLLKSLVAQESKFDPKARNSVGYAGLTQMGASEARGHGLDTGKTDKVGAVWVYDEADERFDPAKSLEAGAAYFVEGREAIEKSVFQHFGETAPEDQHDKFALAVYNAGRGTVGKAWKLAVDAGKVDALWEDLVEGGVDSYLCQAFHPDWSKPGKYKEITQFVVQILGRLNA